MAATSMTTTTATTSSSSSTSSSRSTNAVNRSITDLHTPTWIALISLNSIVRATFFHPFQLALARKRVLGSPASVFQLLRCSWRGGVHTLRHGSESLPFGRGGLRGCYRGFGMALICSLAGEVTYLVSLEYLKSRVASKDSSSTSSHTFCHCDDSAFSGHHWASASSAVVADAGTTLGVVPIALVVGRQMTAGFGMAAANPYRSGFGTAKQVWRLYQPPAPTAGGLTMLSTARHWVRGMGYGVRGLYQGTSAAMMRVPFTGLWWGTYTKSKELLYVSTSPLLQRYYDQQQAKTTSSGRRMSWILSPTDNPVLNAAASMIASVVTAMTMNPIAVIQIRLQSSPAATTAVRAVEAGTSQPAAVASRRAGLTSVVKVLYQQEGIRGFFKGVTMNSCVAVMDGVVFAVIFELTKLGSDHSFLSALREG